MGLDYSQTALLASVAIRYKVPPQNLQILKWSINETFLKEACIIFLLFSCLICATWCNYDVTFYDHPQQSTQIRHIIASFYQKSFETVSISTIYVFLVSHCYN